MSKFYQIESQTLKVVSDEFGGADRLYSRQEIERGVVGEFTAATQVKERDIWDLLNVRCENSEADPDNRDVPFFKQDVMGECEFLHQILAKTLKRSQTKTSKIFKLTWCISPDPSVDH